ncbi:MAG: DUF1338 domain-containing protein [Panacibacter sp.]
MANAVLDKVLDGLMTRYKERVPDVAAVITALIQENVITNASEIENDHIAFRTIGVSFLGIQSLEKIFLHYGYKRMDHYFFPAKKLDAYWYAPPSPGYPRIFISELRVSELSENVQKIIHSYTDEVTVYPVNNIDLNDAAAVDKFLHSGLWRLPSTEDYKALAAETEYAAWAVYNRYYLNHFTVSVHNLKPGYNTIADFNIFLERNGFTLNDSGGKIKTSADGNLLQSSTVAQMIGAPFTDGRTLRISGSYVEFAERKVLKQFSSLPASEIKRKHRREGFEAANADKIFESTYASQTVKR